MKIKPKKIWKFRLGGACPSGTRTEVSGRGFNITIDEPVERGGTNEGLMPVEIFMAGLVGCTNVISHKIAKANDIVIQDMSVDLEVTMDSRGTALWEEIDVPFPEIKILIDLTTDAEDERVDVLKRDLRRHCAVSKVLQQAGSKVTEVWTVRRPGEVDAA